MADPRVSATLAADGQYSIRIIPDSAWSSAELRVLGGETTDLGPAKVDEIVTVTDDEIVAAMRLAFQRLNVVVEPSGASALAAVLSGAVDVTGQRVGITLSGGNVDLDRFRVLTA